MEKFGVYHLSGEGAKSHCQKACGKIHIAVVIFENTIFHRICTSYKARHFLTTFFVLVLAEDESMDTDYGLVNNVFIFSWPIQIT